MTLINADKSLRSRFEVAFNIEVLKGEGKVHLENVWTVDCLSISNWDIPTEDAIDQWLDGDEKAVEILIGNYAPKEHWIFEQRRGRRKQLYVVQTLLG